MFSFPFSEILNKAWRLTGQNLWLWSVGLFLGGGISGMDFTVAIVWLNSALIRIESVADFLSWKVDFLSGLNLWQFLWVCGIFILIGFVFLVVHSFSTAYIILFTDQNTAQKEKTKSISRGVLLRQAIGHTGRVLVIKLLVAGSGLLILTLCAYPVWYFFSAGETGRAAILLLLGLIVVIPAGLVLNFFHIYGPIVSVIYNQRIYGAIGLAFALFKNKLRENLILLALMLGIGLLLWLFIIFSLLVFVLPAAILYFLFFSVGMFSSAGILFAVTVLFALIYVIMIKIGYSIFYNIVWVLAVKKMMGSVDSDEVEQLPVVEPIF